MQALVQILKVNEPRDGKSQDGTRTWKSQTAECVLLNDQGQPDQVGVLRLGKEMQGDMAPKPGVYMGSYAMQVDWKSREIGPVLVELRPYDIRRVAPGAQGAATVQPAAKG